MDAINGHILLQAYNFYGHHKPLCALASKIVHARQVYITHLVPKQLYTKVLSELSRQFEPDEVILREFKRVVAYEAGEDVFAVVAMGLLKCIRTFSGDRVKVLVWNSAAASTSYACAAPLERGGMWGDLDTQLRVYEERGISGEELREIGEKLWMKDDGEIVNLPGVPPMYDYENNPQTYAPMQWAFGISINDIVLMSSPYIEGPVIDAFRDMKNPRPIFAMAPLVPPVNQAEIDSSRKHSAVFRETEKLLNDALSKHGESSVVYLSFGTVFWSAEPEKIWTFLDVLLELEIPVKINQTRRSLRFVSHCGHNSVNESLAEGVPIICWPIMADQPHNAAQLTRLNVSYELFEVRTGKYGLRSVHSLRCAPVGTLEALREETHGVMMRAFGTDRYEKRRNTGQLSNLNSLEKQTNVNFGGATENQDIRRLAHARNA
ncbi:hypothetical protein M0805_004046 [Coniferiporia weirii]|nr:hypothetical protein M0805_004046 [Coniferiporia weirii]